MGITAAILGLAVLILIHEAGHFFVARWVGMTPRKFYLGFGPPLVKRVRNGVEYGIAAFPLGGYVKIPGMHRAAPGDLRKSLKPEEQQALAEPLDALDAALERGDDEGARAQLPQLEEGLGPRHRMLQELDGSLAPEAYWRQATWKRVAVIAAGPAVNIVFAVVVFAALFMLGTTVATRTVDRVIDGRPAAAAGLKSGDEIVAVAGHPVTPSEISKRINATHGKPFRIVVLRGGERVVVGPLRAKRDAGVYRVGFQIAGAPGPGDSLPRATWNAIHLVGEVTSDTVTALAGLAVGQGTQNVSSAVGIVDATSNAYRESLKDFLAVLGLVSLALALLNLLPVLPLDGGHIVMALLERIRGRTFSQLAYLRYSAVGLTLFALLLYLCHRNDLFSGGS
jgi:regulator of sigma E protease